MIEINLIPDVKLELLKTRRQQKMVISGAILVAIISVAVLVLLIAYAFGVQTIADSLASSNITKNTKELTSIKDLSKTLTLQQQVNKLSELQDSTHVTSRLFDVMSVTIPSGENIIKISRLSLDTENNTIDLEAEAPNGYEAMEVFKKTLEQTKLHYSQDGEAAEPVNIAKSISEGERRYGEDAQGNKVLRFTMTFTYPNELFDPTIENSRVVAPNQQRATDSTQGVPESLFGEKGKS